MISVIIPVYNGSLYIDKCLNSIICQKIFLDIEIILVDDGSKDNSLEILKKYSNKYHNIKVYHQENKGVSSARNFGIDVANGEYITFVDIDDYVEDDYFESMYKSIIEGHDLVCGGYKIEYRNKIVENKIKKSIIFDNDKAIRDYLLENNMNVNICSKLYKKDLVRGLRFREDILIGEDRLFLYEYLKKSNSVKILNIAKYIYVQNNISATHLFKEKNLDPIKVSEIITDDISINYKDKLKYAKSNAIDVKCRICGEIYLNGVNDKYKEIYVRLINDVKEYNVVNKFLYSNKKHFISFVLMRINPRLYVGFKYKNRLQFKKI